MAVGDLHTISELCDSWEATTNVSLASSVAAGKLAICKPLASCVTVGELFGNGQASMLQWVSCVAVGKLCGS